MSSRKVGCFGLNEQFRMKKIVLSLMAGAALVAAPTFASATEVTWGGDLMVRPFYRDNQRDFSNQQVDEKAFITDRARLKANIKVDENVGGVVELLHFRKWGASDPNRNVDANGGCAALPCNTTNTLDDNWTDLNQAYISVNHLFDTAYTMQVGRQEMAYGDQRLVGNTNFWSTYPFPRAYDALKFSTKNEDYDLDFWTAKVTSRKFAGLQSAPNVTNATTADSGDRNFHGIWGTLKKAIPDNSVDLYLLNMQDSGYTNPANGAAAVALSTYEGTAVPPNFGQFPYQTNTGKAGITGRTSVYNLGTRIKGKAITNLDYTLELNKQFGSFADGDSIDAFGYAAVVGYTIPDAMGLRVSGEYVLASGDDTPTSGNHKTFYQFSPSPHMHLGAQDLIANQNIDAKRVGASVKPKDNLKVSLDWWDFQLNRVNDLWYSSNGTSTRTGSTFGAQGAEGLLSAKEVGTELDLVANYSYTQALSFEAGYSVFNPGNGIKTNSATPLAGHTNGKGDSATFIWGLLMLKF